MKKLTKVLALSMVLVMGLFILSACGGGSPYEGTWKATKISSFGQEMSAEEAEMAFELTIDGDKATLTMDGEAEEGTFAETDDGATITFEDEEMGSLGTMEFTLTLEDDQLVMDFLGLADIYFEK